MKRYNRKNELREVRCNGCGRTLRVENGMLLEGILEVKQNFGYFSSRDGVTHAFDLCEACYDKLLGSFAIPADETEEFAWQAEEGWTLEV